jgi:membrane-associated protease RseP (regulator of RpoE activity)
MELPAPAAPPVPAIVSAPAKRPGSLVQALLFAATVVSVFFVGLTWSVSYLHVGAPGGDPFANLGASAFREPAALALAAAYAAVLLAILLAHEMGHYLTCRRYGLTATLPYFIPAPTLIGTMGAFIRIRSPITRKARLFDIGANGPLAGFTLAAPALAVGVALSRIVPALPRQDVIVFGEPLLLRLFMAIFLGPVPDGFDIALHPVGFAGWVGVLVTAFNLFPVGQLDGGHVAYAVFGPKMRLVGKVILALFAVLGLLFWAGWFVWGLALLLIGIKHPRILDQEAPLDRRRTRLAALLLLIFILSFIPAPVEGLSGIGLLRGIGLLK